MSISTSNFWLFLIMTFVAFGTEAFLAVANQSARRTSFQLGVWNPPSPYSLPSTWYNEYDPTSRTMVYTDSPTDYTFVTFDNDWPSTAGKSREAEQAKVPPRRRLLMNPLAMIGRRLSRRQR